MDDSRLVLQPPAELSDSGRFLPSQSAQTTPAFECRVCGGTEFTAENRPGVEVVLADLLIYQACCAGVISGTHCVLTCTRCAQSTDKARAKVREGLLSRLLFASRDLAQRQIAVIRQHGYNLPTCTQCGRVQFGEGAGNHETSCPAGRVLEILERLMLVEDPRIMNAALAAHADRQPSAGDGAGASNGGAR